MSEVTHWIAKRKTDAKVTRPQAERLARLIGLMARHWVDPDLAADDMEDRRLAISKGYLVNTLGLLMYVERRVKEGRRPVQIHHLPRQEPRVVSDAVKLLSEHEKKSGVQYALWALVDKHPYPEGGLPDKPGWTHAEADAMGMRKEDRGDDGMNLRDTALAWMSERWVTSREWELAKRSTRLAALVEDLEELGYDICVEMRTDGGKGKRPYAAYRHFTDPAELEKWEQAHAERQRLKAEREERNAAGAKARKSQKKLGLGAATIAQKPRFGGWSSGSTPNAGAVTSPPAAVAQRLANLSGGQAARASGSGGTQRTHDVSAPGVPAAELNTRFPRARSKEVVEHQGARYERKFVPAERSERGEVLRWNASWVPVTAPAGSVGMNR